jgi:muramoyltetrapeptide carboxypeptidase
MLYFLSGGKWVVNLADTIINNNTDIKLISPKEYASDEWFLKKNFKPREVHSHPGWAVLKPANVSGILVGGNLETFLALIGTPYLPHCKDKILLLESTEHNPAKFDRDITQLRHSGILNRLKGLIIGQFPATSALSNQQLVENIVLANTLTQDYPILLNTNFSHVDPLYTIPIGGKVSIGIDTEPYLMINKS